MYRSIAILFAVALWRAPAQTPAQTERPQPQQILRPQAVARKLPATRVYRGVRLGMDRDEVSVVMGTSSRDGGDWEEFKLDGGDLMTVRYDGRDVVNTIQLYFAHPAHAPKWAEVVGDAEIQEKSNGSKFARIVNKEEKFWVTMFQSKSGAITAI